VADPAPVTAIIVHRNRPDALLATLGALGRQGLPIAALVVDNGSTDAALAVLGGLDDVEVLETGENLGFGPGANVGLRRWLADSSPGDWVLILPHDALPLDDTVATMLDTAARRPQAGLISADVGDQTRPLVDRTLGPIPGPAIGVEGWEPCDYPHGTLIGARHECLVDVGLFDERYFAYNEEADLGLRAGYRGWEVGLIRGARVENPDQSTAHAVIDYLRLRNTVLLVRSHSGRWPALVHVGLAATQLVVWRFVARLRPPWYSPRARWRALADAIRHRYGPPPVDLS